MDRVNRKIRTALGGLRQSVTTPQRADTVEETLRSEHFQIAKTVRHGFPYQPTAMAWDSVQHLLAIGTKTGSVRIFGRPGVDCHIKHDGEVGVIQILFLVNEGAMITACADDQLHLWNLRQKKPEIVHSLKFQRERITCCHLPFQSKWLYVGSERGNVHIVNIEKFEISGYIINWNKAIELSRKTHPGQVVHLSGNPQDPNKLLIGFESGLIVSWDLRSKAVEMRFNCPESLRSVCWHQDGRQLMASHSDGSLTMWNTKTPNKPQSILMPHAKVNSEGKPEPCRTIQKVEWKCVKSGDPYIIFSGGMPKDRAMRSPSITVMHGKSTTVLEMEHNVIDFITLGSTPWDNELQDVYGIIVLLENDLVVIDLTTPGYPCFENPYPMDIHEAPVTACKYLADCPPDIIPALYQVGFKQKKTGFSEKEWPVKGGNWGTTTCSYPEIIISGHADGSLKFWDASAATLQFLYKLKTNRLFDKSKCKSPEPDDDPFAIQHIYFCGESRLLMVAGQTHVILFKFCKQETTSDCPMLETAIIYEIYDDTESPEMEYPPKPSIGSVSQQSGSVGSCSSTCSDSPKYSENSITSVRVKSGSKKWSAGFVPELCCVLQWVDGEPPPPITSISLNSKFGLMAFGNECGIAIVDLVQKCCLLNMGTPDLYGPMDPFGRTPRSPKNKNTSQPSSIISGVSYSGSANNDDSKSPTSEQSVITRSYPEGRSHGNKNRPHTYALSKIAEMGMEKPQGKNDSDEVGGRARHPSADDLRIPNHQQYMYQDEDTCQSLPVPPRRPIEPPKRPSKPPKRQKTPPKRPTEPPKRHESSSKEKEVVKTSSGNEVVFDLMPGASPKLKIKPSTSSEKSVTSPDIDSSFDFVPDAYDSPDGVIAGSGGNKSDPSTVAPKKRHVSTSHLPDNKEELVSPGERYNSAQHIFPSTVKNDKSTDDDEKSPESGKEDSTKSSKKHKKKFFQKLLHADKNDESNGNDVEMKTNKAKDEASHHPVSAAASKTHANDSAHDSQTTSSITTCEKEHSKKFQDDEDEDNYLKSASSGLRRGSKSDYDIHLLNRSMPAGSSLEKAENNLSKSSQHLTKTCDSSTLKSALTDQQKLKSKAQSSHVQSSMDSNLSQSSADTQNSQPNSHTNTETGPNNSSYDHKDDGGYGKILEELERERQKEASKESLMRKFSRKVRAMGMKSTEVTSPSPDDHTDGFLTSIGSEIKKKKANAASDRFEVIDLSADDVAEKPPIRKLTYRMHVTEMMDGGSFSRSRSSSMSSLENISKEAIQCLVFADAFTRKGDNCTCPCLWVGTSLGSVLVIDLKLPSEQDRKREPVVVSPSGTIFRLKGAILCMSFLDCNGILQGATTADQWTDSPTKEKRTSQYFRQQSSASLVSTTSNASSEQPVDRQYAIICSERHARVVSLPSQTVVYKHKVTDTSIVARADVITIKNTVCLACYIANGHVITLSLPSLRPLLDKDFLPLTDLRIAKTFQFSNNGHAMYFCSASELQKITLSADITVSLDEMLGELFLPCDTPEAPKKTFLQNIFGSGPSTLDREQLFGEASGKASKSVAKKSAGNAGMANARQHAASATSEIGRAKLAALERGEKLGQAVDATDQMRTDAEEFARNAHMLANKYKKQKWWQF